MRFGPLEPVVPDFVGTFQQATPALIVIAILGVLALLIYDLWPRNPRKPRR